MAIPAAELAAVVGAVALTGVAVRRRFRADATPPSPPPELVEVAPGLWVAESAAPDAQPSALRARRRECEQPARRANGRRKHAAS